MQRITARHLATAATGLVLVTGLAACGNSSTSATTTPSGTVASGTTASGSTVGSGAGSAPGSAATGTTTGTGAGQATLGNPSSATGNTTPGSTATGTDPAGSTTPPKLTIKANTVSPKTLTVTPGQTIDIANSDAVAHDLVDATDKISSGTIKAKGNGTLTAPSTAGTYLISDPNHTGTKLTLVVS